MRERWGRERERESIERKLKSLTILHKKLSAPLPPLSGHVFNFVTRFHVLLTLSLLIDDTFVDLTPVN